MGGWGKQGLKRGRGLMAALRLVTALALALMLPTPARAGMDQTWIAAEGVDSGLCLIYLPCRTLAFALDQTAPSGTINVIDSGDYGAVTVDKAITIRSELGQPSMIASITIKAGANDRVMIQGIDLQGTATALGLAYPYGISVIQAADVLIHNVRIKDYNAPGTVGSGVYINSQSWTRVTISDCLIFNNTVGVWVTSSGPGGAHLKAFHSLLLANTESGVRVVGTGNDAWMSNNSMLGSTKAMDLRNGGTARSFANNAITSGEAPIGMTMY